MYRHRRTSKWTVAASRPFNDGLHEESWANDLISGVRLTWKQISFWGTPCVWITSKRGIQIWGNGHHIIYVLYIYVYTHTLFLLSFPHISFSATVLYYYFSIAFGSWNFAHLLWYCFFLFPVAIGRFWRFAGCCFISSVRGGRLKDDASHGRSFKFWAPYVVPSVERSWRNWNGITGGFSKCMPDDGKMLWYLWAKHGSNHVIGFLKDIFKFFEMKVYMLTRSITLARGLLSLLISPWNHTTLPSPLQKTPVSLHTRFFCAIVFVTCKTDTSHGSSRSVCLLYFSWDQGCQTWQSIGSSIPSKFLGTEKSWGWSEQTRSAPDICSDCVYSAKT